MKILFVSDSINPFETDFGGGQRSNLLLRACCDVARTDVICLKDNVISNISNCDVIFSSNVKETYKSMGRLEKWCRLLFPWSLYSYYQVGKQCANIVAEQINKKHYDYVVVRYISDVMKFDLLRYKDRLVIDIDDNPKDLFMREATTGGGSKFVRLHKYLSALLVPIALRHTLRKIHGVFFTNPDDDFRGKSKYLPNIPYSKKTITAVADFSKTNPRLFFVGLLDFKPNYMGLDYFITRIWSIIRSQIPNAELHIGGKIECEYVVTPYFERWRTYEGVRIIGFVPDLLVEYRDCRATISPIYIGAGTNIKLLESMQMHRPCVTTICGARGTQKYFCPGEDFLVAKTDEEFADEVVQILTDEEKNHTIAKNAYAKLEKNFSYEAFSSIVKSILT